MGGCSHNAQLELLCGGSRTTNSCQSWDQAQGTGTALSPGWGGGETGVLRRQPSWISTLHPTAASQRTRPRPCRPRLDLGRLFRAQSGYVAADFRGRTRPGPESPTAFRTESPPPAWQFGAARCVLCALSLSCMTMRILGWERQYPGWIPEGLLTRGAFQGGSDILPKPLPDRQPQGEKTSSAQDSAARSQTVPPRSPHRLEEGVCVWLCPQLLLRSRYACQGLL